MVFQSYALYPHKSVRDNLAFALRVRGVATADIDRRVETTAAALGLERLLDRRPSQLSGGQRQRVALGRAIVREPKAFLLDEPLSNLDPLLRLETRSEIALLHRRLGATMVYVTHDQEEAMTLGRRVAVMRDGTLEQVGAPLDLFRRPANVFVATFIGSPAMNVWQCRCETTAAAQLRATCGPFSLDIPGSRLNGRPAGRVMVGVRPQDIALAARDESDVPARVEIVEPLGATAVVHARISGDAPLIRVVVSADDVPAVDDEVGLRVRRDRLHLFDAETGVSLDAVDAAR
jgi:multiple sugar transport system ATP-binding protein